jgi:hypothetical protein
MSFKLETLLDERTVEKLIRKEKHLKKVRKDKTEVKVKH